MNPEDSKKHVVKTNEMTQAKAPTETKPDIYAECLNSIEKLKAHPKAPLFFSVNTGIDGLKLSDVEDNLKNGKYNTTQDFINAVKSIWKSFWNQRNPGSSSYMAATELSQEVANIATKITIGIKKG